MLCLVNECVVLLYTSRWWVQYSVRACVELTSGVWEWASFWHRCCGLASGLLITHTSCYTLHQIWFPWLILLSVDIDSFVSPAGQNCGKGYCVYPSQLLACDYVILKSGVHSPYFESPTEAYRKSTNNSETITQAHFHTTMTQLNYCVGASTNTNNLCVRNST